MGEARRGETKRARRGHQARCKVPGCQNVMASPELIWQCVKGGNSFMRKGLNGTILSAEPGNLTSKHSFKYSGLANAKSVGLTESDGAVVLSKGKPKSYGKPKSGVAKTTMK